MKTKKTPAEPGLLKHSGQEAGVLHLVDTRRGALSTESIRASDPRVRVSTGVAGIRVRQARLAVGVSDPAVFVQLIPDLGRIADPWTAQLQRRFGGLADAHAAWLRGDQGREALAPDPARGGYSGRLVMSGLLGMSSLAVWRSDLRAGPGAAQFIEVRGGSWVLQLVAASGVRPHADGWPNVREEWLGAALAAAIARHDQAPLCCDWVIPSAAADLGALAPALLRQALIERGLLPAEAC